MCVFFFKQKTAYDVRISDWSSDVCSSDLHRVVAIAYDRLCTFEFGIAAEIFGLPRPEFTEWYGFSVWAADEGPMRASGGYRLLAERDGSLLDAADTIVVPGDRKSTRLNSSH